jgi:putative transport protein
VVAVGTQQALARLTALVGDDVEELFKTQFAPVSIGVVVGMLAGQLPLPGLGVTLGTTGGTLLASMYLGHRVKLAGILWQIPQQTNGFLKQLSLYIFFAAAGSNAGRDLVELVTASGAAPLVAAGVALAFLPVLLTYAVATLLLRKSPLEVVGLLAGNLNTTTILINANDVLETDIPNLSFAFAYPVGLLLALATTEAAWLLLPLVR